MADFNNNNNSKLESTTKLLESMKISDLDNGISTRSSLPCCYSWLLQKRPVAVMLDNKGKKQMVNISINPRIISSNEGPSGGPAAATMKVESMAVEAAETPSLNMPKTTNDNTWTVAEVSDLLRNIPGCASYADELRMQGMNEALLLIQPEHLVMASSMKRGPALKTVACVDSLSPKNEQQTDHD